MAKPKTKEYYSKFLDDMFAYFADKKNKDKFNYKRYFFERGIKMSTVKQFIMRYPDLKEKYYDVKHVIAANIEELILTNKLNKESFAIRYLKMMFQIDMEYHLPEERANYYKLKSETQLAKTQIENIKIGFEDDDADND